ncbi:polysaccharide deacetylase family protein [Vitiosangium sp. GDMCC 1.1324]|uniref:polysaccharide deacetylase family protein n=1 Tax=Vitiosangium sp. (strain GDMCC 1.1324) TaxID=2138576 RepID=UPI000D39F547|nr:polysaccharide deacetylase family protein [Vitiosangium sp. GDMCC 1.1324]PTL80782.1 polysaccharide deacetylase [Vitiosangium sp. GDMCC 1.1324]
MNRKRWIRWAVGTPLVALGLLVGLWQLSRSWSFQLLGELYDRVETTEKVVALTFDDGPRPGQTEAVLGILKRHGVKASFFMVGENIERNRELAARVLAEGHQLGNHSYSHHRLIFKSPSFIREEIDKTDALLREVGVEGESLFRAPYGKKLVVLPWLLKQGGRKHITFDAVSRDDETQDVDLLTSRVMESVRPGSIILFHDGGRNKPGTLQAVDIVIGRLRAQEYRFVTVSELLTLGGITPAAETTARTAARARRRAHRSRRGGGCGDRRGRRCR